MGVRIRLDIDRSVHRVSITGFPQDVLALLGLSERPALTAATIIADIEGDLPTRRHRRQPRKL